MLYMVDAFNKAFPRISGIGAFGELCGARGRQHGIQRVRSDTPQNSADYLCQKKSALVWGRRYSKRRHTHPSIDPSSHVDPIDDRRQQYRIVGSEPLSELAATSLYDSLRRANLA